MAQVASSRGPWRKQTSRAACLGVCRVECRRDCGVQEIGGVDDGEVVEEEETTNERR
jgi:hypothetical protein